MTSQNGTARRATMKAQQYVLEIVTVPTIAQGTTKEY